MPRRLEVLRATVGTKSEFTKLQVTHAVVGNDSAAIGKAIEKIDKLPDSISRLTEWLPPYHELEAAVKAFQSKYGSKHPKFIQAVKQGFLNPVEKVIEQGNENAESLRKIPEQLKACTELLDHANAFLAAKPLNDQIVQKAMDALAGAGSVFSAATLRASELARDYSVGGLQKVADMAPLKKVHLDPILAGLDAMKKQKNYNADLTPALHHLITMHDICAASIKTL
jgi:hypothetical protein